MHWKAQLLILSVLLATAGSVSAMGSGSKSDLRISANQLHKMLGNPNLVIIDVRDPVSWEKSNRKIRGAIREDPQNVKAWANKYDKDETIVFYCA